MTLFLAGSGFPSAAGTEGIDAAWDEFVTLATGTGRKRGTRRRRRITAPSALAEVVDAPASEDAQEPLPDAPDTTPEAPGEPEPPTTDRVWVLAADQAQAEVLKEAVTARGPEVEVIVTTISPDAPLELPEFPELLNGLVLGEVEATTLLAALGPHRSVVSRLVRQDTPLLAFGAASATAGTSVPGPELAPVQALQLVGVAVSVEPVLNNTLAAMSLDSTRTTVVVDPDAVLRVDAVTGRTKVLGTGRTTWVARANDQFVIHYEPTSAPTGEND